MARKNGPVAEFVLFDAFYEDGSQRSNRRVPAEAIAYQNDPNAAAKAVLEQQDREIAEKSGKPPIPIRTVKRSRSK